ncbi:MAG TPA: LeuA family protein, partial [Planctomycetota bacterium]|nr:LeuA family protein [Planctomycetota bacterium]
RPDLVHDWNVAASRFVPERPVELDDETLRDGLQSPSVRDPDLDRKLRIVRLMDALGIDTCDVGLPGAGPRAREHIETLVREMRDGGLKIGANVACRTLVSDIAPAADLVQRLGHPVEVCAFIGSSPIRQYAEGWDLPTLLRHTREAMAFCRKENLPCMFVTEDTTRAHPETLRSLFLAAIEEGARRICACDTCGHATPEGVRNLIRFVRGVTRESGVEVKVDWHGHRDRGLGLANCLAAIEAGANRIHGTALGIGERAGNAEMDLLLVNLKLLGWKDHDLRPLPDYCREVAEAVGVPIPHNYPVVGHDAFETATGVHAAAVVKAFRKGDRWLADRVYSGVPAGEFGLEQRITIGPMSGRSNVVYFLERRGVEASEERVTRILELAKRSARVLTEEEVLSSI